MHEIALVIQQIDGVSIPIIQLDVGIISEEGETSTRCQFCVPSNRTGGTAATDDIIQYPVGDVDGLVCWIPQLNELI